MSNDILNCMNKGVPVSTEIMIGNSDFLKIVGEKSSVTKVVKKHFYDYMDYINSFGYSTDISYFSTMCSVIDDETLRRKLIFAPSAYFAMLIFNLNLDNICAKGLIKEFEVKNSYKEKLRELDEELRERISLLNSITNEEQLKKEFPLLYNQFRLNMENVKTSRKYMVTYNRMNNVQKKKFIASLEKKYPGADIKTSLKRSLTYNMNFFINECFNFFTSILDNGDKIIDYILSHPIDMSEIEIADKNKLELFFAYKNLERAEASISNKQDYLYYVSSFFAEHNDLLESDLSIVVNNSDYSDFRFIKIEKPDEIVVTPIMLYERYRKLLVDNPELRAIDFSYLDFEGMTSGEVKQFMDEYLKDLSAQWDFLEPTDYSYEKMVVEKIKNSGQNMTEEERKKHQERLLDLFIEKKTLYDSSDPFFRVKGKNTFDGYIGYIYSNGRVVLDKFYEDANDGKLADGHAVYAMGIQQFYELSKFSKIELIRNKLCNRYIHKGNWASRILENEICVETGTVPCVEVKQLIKKGDIIVPTVSEKEDK